MVSKRIRMVLMVAVGLAASYVVLSDTAAVQAQMPSYNYYVAPGVGLGAQMYPCPRPTPPWVGHTVITYQPLNPHEFLYPHRRVYFTPHPSGVTRTSVWWH
ncbi:MAG: hypothetical protein GXY83_33615 [Rhodopirellula sp.]|nr:hypothetical protein [Rhodopirellula sp.]